MATLTDASPLESLATVRDDVEQSQRASVDGRLGVVAKAVIDLNYETRSEIERRLDRIETLILTGFGEMDARFGEMEARFGRAEARLNARLDELSSTVNRIDAQVQKHAGWIAKDEEKGKPQG
jgi:tetrahydromethanopterin S-methyltransferase subunit G